MHTSDPGYCVPPFPAFPATSRYVPLGSLEDSLGRVCRSVDAREAISLVIGPPGTGKSLMGGLLAEHYQQSHDVVILGETPLEDRGSFLRRILHHLGVDLSSVPEGDLQLALIDHVCSENSPEGGLLLVVDEAQSLSSEVMESIRTITNIMHGGEPRVFAVVCGGVKLEEKLVEPSMESFTQRVSTRCYLHPLNGEETSRYVNETIRSCGADPDETITAEAIASVHHACRGVPRLLNQLLTQVIDCAEEAGQSLIDDSIIDRAWAQLQQLPSPMVDEPKIQNDATAIEFGELDESVSFDDWSDEKSSEPDMLSIETGGDEADMLSTEADCDEADMLSTETDCETAECQGGCAGEGTCSSANDETSLPMMDDIVVEHPSAWWVDEPVEDAIETPMLMETELEDIELAETEPEPIETTKSSVVLFGEFDEEEEIPVVESIAAQPPAVSDESPMSLEEMLHQEIIGISTYHEPIGETVPCVASGQDAGVESMESPGDTEESDTEESDTEEYIEDFVITRQGPSETHTPENPDVLRFADSSMENETSRSPVGDDSDILVIEEELELRRIDKPASPGKIKEAMLIDLKTMFSRMRSGS